MRSQSANSHRSPAAALCGGALAVLVALAAGPAAAEEVIYGPDGAPTVVQRKLYTMTGRTEVALRGTVALNTSLVDHYGGLLTVSYHPNEWFDAGVDAFANYTALSSLVGQIREKPYPRSSTESGGVTRPNTGDELANAGQLRFGGLAMARIAPIYGKLDLASEVKLHFQAFLLLGAGAGLVHHESVNLCASAGTSPCPADQFQITDSLKPLGEVGGGFRFYLSTNWSLGLEVRAFLYPATLKEQNDLTNPTSGTPTTYLGLVTDFAVGIARTF